MVATMTKVTTENSYDSDHPYQNNGSYFILLLFVYNFILTVFLSRVSTLTRDIQRRRQSTGTRGAMDSFRGGHGEREEREPITGV